MTDKQVFLRPEENPDLIGHETAERLLWRDWQGGRLAHAWLLGGPRGIGKATLACRLARFILAADSPGRNGRNREGSNGGSLYLPPDHPTFCRVAAHGHADFRLIERSVSDTGRRRSQIVVEDIRAIGKFLTLTAAEGGWRVVVIDEAEVMNDSAANALLKVLEEPPPRSLLLLVSHSPRRLLLTVRSRCRLLPLHPLTERHVGTLLTRYRPVLAHAEALTVARLAEGSIGRAMELVDNDGLALYRTMLELLTGLPHLDGPALHAFGDRIAQGEGRMFAICGELLGGWLARMIRHGVPPLSATVPGEERLAVHVAANLEQWVAAWEKIGHLFDRAEVLNLDRKQVILNAFLAVGRLVRHDSQGFDAWPFDA